MAEIQQYCTAGLSIFTKHFTEAFALSPTNQISHQGAHPPKSSVVSGAGRLPLSKQFNEYLPIYVCLRKNSGVAS